MSDPEDYLEHFGVKGMRWGKRRAERKAARDANNAAINTARQNQAVRKAELNTLTVKRLRAQSAKGKALLDSKIIDKQFEIKHHPDAQQAAKLKTGEKWLKGGRTAAVLGLSIVGLGAAASIINQELNNIDNSTLTKSEGSNRSLVMDQPTIAVNTPGNTAYARAKGIGG